MELNEYQEKAMLTCMKESENLSYMLLNLVSEVGEFAGKIAKGVRGGDVAITNNVMVAGTPDTYKKYDFDHALKKEAGDILWQLSGLCAVMGWTLEDIAQINLQKLTIRQAENKIHGNGDDR